MCSVDYQGSQEIVEGRQILQRLISLNEAKALCMVRHHHGVIVKICPS